MSRVGVAWAELGSKDDPGALKGGAGRRQVPKAPQQVAEVGQVAGEVGSSGPRWTEASPSSTSYGWGYTPESLRRVLVRVSNEYTKLPLYVTESGASLHDYVDPEGRINDVERIDYLTRYFAAAAQAISGGVDLRGYFVWSIFDNFEWQHGYSMRFGLFYVEFSSQRRIPKASAHWYRQFITAASS